MIVKRLKELNAVFRKSLTFVAQNFCLQIHVLAVDQFEGRSALTIVECSMCAPSLCQLYVSQVPPEL